MATKRDRQFLRAIPPLLITALLCAAAGAATIYVDDDAPDFGDGSSWETAYKHLQDALAEAEAAEGPVEIRVAQGLYRPDRSSADPDGTGDRKATFHLLDRTTIKGGYAGLAAADPNERDIEAYATVLSGDLAGNDVLSEDPCDFVFAPEDGYWPRPEEWCLVHESTRRENSLHVVTSDGVDQSAVLDGFVVTAGNAFQPPYWLGHDAPVVIQAKDQGAGITNRGGSPRLLSCTFVDNSAYGDGGAMYNAEVCNPVVRDCRFENCYVLFGEGTVCSGDANNRESGVQLEMTGCTFRRNSVWWRSGAGVANYYGSLVLQDCCFKAHVASSAGAVVHAMRSTAVFDHCRFHDNHCRVIGVSETDLLLTHCRVESNSCASTGGGLSLRRSNASLRDCSLIGNQAKNGGAIYADGELALENCLFAGNCAAENGGAVHGARLYPVVTNCTFFGNRAHEGGALWLSNVSQPILKNSVLWSNQAVEGPSVYLLDIDSAPSSVCVSYSALEAGRAGIWHGASNEVFWGSGNVDVDPSLAGPGYWDPNGTADEPSDDFWVDGDYHLKSQAGRWDPATDNWVTDDITSPCIDAGDPNRPIGPEPFPNGGRINMGAYGGTAEASKSWFGEPVCETIIAGDINGDCCVDFKDFQILSLHWLESQAKARE
jgi:predicted outer membrane repeat protein